jgi:hypothetical protein
MNPATLLAAARRGRSTVRVDLRCVGHAGATDPVLATLGSILPHRVTRFCGLVASDVDEEALPWSGLVNLWTASRRGQVTGECEDRYLSYLWLLESYRERVDVPDGARSTCKIPKNGVTGSRD